MAIDERVRALIIKDWESCNYYIKEILYPENSFKRSQVEALKKSRPDLTKKILDHPLPRNETIDSPDYLNPSTISKETQFDNPEGQFTYYKELISCLEHALLYGEFPKNFLKFRCPREDYYRFIKKD